MFWNFCFFSTFKIIKIFVNLCVCSAFMRTLSICITNWCVHWTCASGTYSCTEHTHHELMRVLSIRIRYLCVHWAKVPSNMLSIKRKELIRALRLPTRNLRVCSACAKEIKWCLTPRKVNSSYRLSGAKIMKVVYHATWKKKQPVMKAKYYFPDFLNNPSEDQRDTLTQFTQTGSRDRFQKN